MNFEKLNALMESQPDRGIPFSQIIVTKDGKTVFEKSVGFADAEGKLPYTGDRLCWIFSCTKVITCVAAMRLVEEGRLRLSDPVSKYLPAFGELTVMQKDRSVVPAQNVMTVEHLFTMTGGLDYDLRAPAILEAVSNPNNGTVEIVSAMAKKPLQFEPGTHYAYSLCHDVLAAVVEVVSGMRFSDYLKTYLLDPLGMTNTGFRPTPEQEARICSSFDFDIARGEATPRVPDNAYALSHNYDSGGAGLFSCPADYIQLLTALACNGVAANGYQVLKPETIAMMEENRLCDTAWKDFINRNGRHYGYGWGLCGRVHVNPVYSHAATSVGEFGWDGAAGAYALVDRKNGVAIYYAQQVRGCGYVYNAIHPRLRDLAMEGILEK